MSFNIPGYFLDKKTNKLFKITPHGPYSLSELRKRVQREEEEEAAASFASMLNKSQIRPPTNINQFLAKRARLVSRKSTMDHTVYFLMSQLKTRSKVKLDQGIQKYNSMLVETTQNADYGEFFMMNRLGLHHFGYELDPQFRMWQSDGGRYIFENTISMHLRPRQVEMNGRQYRVLMGTSGGCLWSSYFEILPPLINDELEHMLTDSRNEILPTPIRSYVDALDLQSGQEFVKKKDLFWCFDTNDSSVVIGGDQKLYQLDADHFRLQSSQRVKSSIFATHIPKSHPNTCWTGSRNGNVSLMDWRHHAHGHRFTQSSSIVQIQSLNNRCELLTVGLDGSIDIWDTRKLKRKHGNEPPIISLKGHVNESTRSLGFDVDLQNNLLMAAGSDGHVRVWSLADHCNNGNPIWTSRKYASPVPACKFKTTPFKYPKFQPGWESIMDNVATRQLPGVLLFGTTENNDDVSVEWLTPIL